MRDCNASTSIDDMGDVQFTVSEVSVGKGKLVLGGLAVLLVMGACNDAGEEDGRLSAVSAETSAAPAVDHEIDGGESGPGGEPRSTSGGGSSVVADDETGVIGSVIDGDTLVLADGRVVRVLGIDSCEVLTYSGRQAQTDAQRLLSVGQIVDLRREPGVDRDIYGRQLRYVSIPGGQDFGQAMIGFEHTGIFEGGDASAAYTAQLRRLDDGPRSCVFLPPTTTRPTTTPTTTAPGSAADVGAGHGIWGLTCENAEGRPDGRVSRR